MWGPRPCICCQEGNQICLSPKPLQGKPRRRPRCGNVQGLERALAAGAREVAVFPAATEAFNQRNLRCSTADSLRRSEQVARAALAAGARVRGYISCAVGCPYEVCRTPVSASMMMSDACSRRQGVRLLELRCSVSPEQWSACTRSRLGAERRSCKPPQSS